MYKYKENRLKSPLRFWVENGSPNPDQKTRPSVNWISPESKKKAVEREGDSDTSCN